jgi:hypothetical protein
VRSWSTRGESVVITENSIQVTGHAESASLPPMVEWLKQLAYALGLRFKSRARLEAENLVLRQ